MRIHKESFVPSVVVICHGSLTYRVTIRQGIRGVICDGMRLLAFTCTALVLCGSCDKIEYEAEMELTTARS